MHTVHLSYPKARHYAASLVHEAPPGSVVKIEPPVRTLPQNARFWAMLTDVSKSKPCGKEHSPETWKLLFMHAFGHEVRFEMGLNGEPFPVGFRSSRLSKPQMAELMEFISAWGTQNGVQWSDL